MNGSASWTAWNGLRSLLGSYVGMGFRRFAWTLATTGLAITAAVALCGFFVAWEGEVWKGWLGAGIGAAGGLLLGLAVAVQYTAYSLVQTATTDLKAGERVADLLLGRVDESLKANEPTPASPGAQTGDVQSTDVVRVLREQARSLLAERPAEPQSSVVRSWIARATQSAIVWGTTRVLSGKLRKIAGAVGQLNLGQLRQSSLSYVDEWIVSAVGIRLLIVGAAFAGVVLSIVLILARAVREFL